MYLLIGLVLLFALFRFVKSTKPRPMVSKEVIAKVQGLIQSNQIFIASKSYCPYCRSTIGTFASLGVKPLVLQLDELPDGQQIQDALREITGQNTVPNIFIEGKHIGGNSDLQAINSTGDLQNLLKL